MGARSHRHLLRLLLLVLLIMTMLIGGVYSKWNYKTNGSTPYSQIVDMSLFLWNEIPEGEEGRIIKETNIAVAESLNNKNSELNSAIDSKRIFGLKSISSVDNLHGDQIRKELGLDPKANFLVEYPDANTRIVYTSTVQMGGQSALGAPTFNIPEGEWIYPVYKTVATYNETRRVWEQGSTQRGYATSGEYVTFLTAAPFFRPETWRRGKLGYNEPTAIFAYQGQSVRALLDEPSDIVYYKLTIPTNNAKVSISITSPSAGTVRVKRADGKAISVNGNGTSKASFKNNKRNSTYYLELTGGTDIAFSIN